ncbi:MAG: UDP-N-acetylglucosamine 1-carboxyvinyltransferase [Oscillospiraceae bacterium]|jgi:UDP-N-acetylglucosamine 1-carboxyvinyltransferase|nr:UDP-N-acetylglucosamine 1-carboxyvinyltransferase [Oscillospiraceae bacterium]
MSKYIIRGGTPLRGQITISGAKNAAVAIIPAALLVDGVCRVENVPDISDVDMLFSILRQMGASITDCGSGAFEIDCRGVKTHAATGEAMQKIRASYYLIGALLARCGRADVAMPGGCNFGGPRPIDQHVKGFTAMGAEIDVKNGILTAVTDGGLRGASIFLDGIPSVGATINIMLAAAKADGTTIIENAAREPHIVDLANFLNYMGANIRGAGTNVIRIRGVKNLKGGSYSIISDQIEAGTYMAAAAGTGGRVEIINIIPKHLECISGKLREMGVEVYESGDSSIVVESTRRFRKIDVTAMPYPGFPTDMQPQIAALLCLADGTSTVTDNVFDTRFKYVDELAKMGASIRVTGRTAIIQGLDRLTGAPIRAHDLRAGAALVIAGLCANGTTEVEGVSYIERGYEDIVGKLRSLGADIISVDDGGELSESAAV